MVVVLTGLSIYTWAIDPIIGLARRVFGLKGSARLRQESAVAFRLAEKANRAHKSARRARSRLSEVILNQDDSSDSVELLRTSQRVSQVSDWVLMSPHDIAYDPKSIPVDDAWERYASPSDINQALDQVRQLRLARQHYLRARRSYRSASRFGSVETYNRGCGYHRAGNVAYLLALDGPKLRSWLDD